MAYHRTNPTDEVTEYSCMVVHKLLCPALESAADIGTRREAEKTMYATRARIMILKGTTIPATMAVVWHSHESLVGGTTGQDELAGASI